MTGEDMTAKELGTMRKEMTLLERQIDFHERQIAAYRKLSGEADLADRFKVEFERTDEKPIGFRHVMLGITATHVEIDCWGANYTKEAIEPLRWLARNGCRLAEKPTPSNSAVKIDWKLRGPGKDKSTLVFGFWMDGPDAECKMVKIGEKVVDVTEIRCAGKKLILPGLDGKALAIDGPSRG